MFSNWFLYQCMTVSSILTYKRSAKIYKYIKHEIKKCHTRNTMLCYVCDMLCYMCNTTNIITECNLVTNISQEGTIIQSEFLYQRDNMTQKVNGIISLKYFASSHDKNVSSTVLVDVQSKLSGGSLWAKTMMWLCKVHMILSPLWHSWCQPQQCCMRRKLTLAILQGLWKPGMTCRPLPNVLARQMHAAEYRL